MKVIDKNGRLFGKVSILDLLVLVVVLVLAFALYIKTNHRGITKVINNEPIVFQVKATCIRNFLSNAIQVGDVVYDLDKPDTGGPLGTITNIDYSEASTMVSFDDGVIVEDVPYDDAVNLLITIQGEGSIDDRTFMLNRIYPLGVNANRNLCTTYAQFSGVVTDIHAG